MSELSDAHALVVERSCAVTAVALSGQRREGVRLVTGEHRQFSLNPGLDHVLVPYPSLARDWTRRTLTCGVALQCSPSKERLAHYRLNELTARELRALTLVEAAVALGWVAANWPGLVVEARRLLPDLEMLPDDMTADAMLERAISLSRNGQPVGDVPGVVGRLPLAYTVPQGLSDKLRRSFGRMPWTTTQKRLPRPYSVPVGGDGESATPTCRHPAAPRTTTSISPRSTGPAFPIRNGTPGQRVSCAITSRFSNALTPAATANPGWFRPTCASGSRSTPTAR